MLQMADATPNASPEAPDWRGFHHVALVTRDLDATLSFYRDILGMEVVFVAPATEFHGRHGAVRPGGERDRIGLHFFEYSQAPLFRPSDRSPMAAVFDPGATFLSHISLALLDEAAGLALRDRLTRNGVETSPIIRIDTTPISIMGFFDNNGVPLEAAWPNSVQGGLT